MLTIAFEAPKNEDTFNLIVELSERGYAVTVQPTETAANASEQAPERQQVPPEYNPFKTQPKKKRKYTKRAKGEPGFESSVIDRIREGILDRAQLREAVKLEKGQFDRTLIRLKNKGVLDYRQNEIIPLKVA